MSWRDTQGLPRRIEIQAGGSARQDIEPSIRMALASIRQQLFALQQAINQRQELEGTAANELQYLTINNNMIVMTNTYSAALTNGQVVVIDDGFDESVTLTTTEGDIKVCGVVYSDSPDGVADAIEVGETGMICTHGLCNIKVDADAGAISPGDYIKTSTTAGTAIKADYISDDGVFAMALEDKASGTGRIYCFVTQLPMLRVFHVERLTADNAGQVTLSRTPQADAPWCGTFVGIIFDSVNSLYYYPDGMANFFANHSSAVLSAVGAVVTNPRNDWNTSVDGLQCIYMPVDRNQIYEARSIIASHIMTTGFNGLGVDSYAFSFYTTAGTIAGAIAELHREIDVLRSEMGFLASYEDFYYDATGSETGGSGYITSSQSWRSSAGGTALNHIAYTYSNNVSMIYLVGEAHSMTYEDATGTRLIEKAFEYQDERLSRIITELTEL